MRISIGCIKNIDLKLEMTNLLIKFIKIFRLNTSFVNAAHERNVDLIPIDFGAADEAKYVINNWVANSTNNHIKELIISPDGLGTDSKVVLTNR